MTPEQRTLARHALGLPNRRKVSYRNRYVTGTCVEDHPLWHKMVQQGWAAHERGVYYLTEQGALLALDPGEALDPEDFPA
jgi:hypothetical protein